MVNADFGGIERALGQPDAAIDPRGSLELEQTASYMPEQESAAHEHLQAEIAKAAIDAAMFEYMAQRLGSRVVRVAQLPSDLTDVRPREAGLLGNLFGTTQTAHVRRGNRVVTVTKRVATAKPIPPKKSKNKPDDKPKSKKK